MPITLRELIAEPELKLRLVAGTEADSLDRELTWVHSSDLIDPTPWLEPGQLLLTDGSQFGGDASVTEYVRRLRDAEIVGLGYAVGVITPELPQALVDACRDQQLPLVVVANRLPFIRIIRHVADAIAADRSARVTRSIRAQRAIARAALQPNGLAATLRELEVQLDCWVVLYDRLGRRVRLQTKRAAPAELLDELSKSVAATLRGAKRASRKIETADGEITLQTIGRTGDLLGALVIGTAVTLDAESNDLIASVLGIASIAIEQSRVLDAARHELRRGVLALLQAGATYAALAALRALEAWVPEGAVVVSAVRGVRNWESTLGELEVLAEGAEFAFARVGDELIVFEAAGRDPRPSAEAFAGRELMIGVSAPVDLDDFSEGLRQARQAVERARPGAPVEFGALAELGMLAWLEAADGAVAARRLLAPLHDRSDAAELLHSAEVWFAHNCAWDPAARELGMHRHTLRARIDQLGEICQLDLEDFGARAELYTALRLRG